MASNTVELEFRDGARVVPVYLADMMSGIETFRYTFEEARSLANNRLSGDYLNKVQRQIIGDSFRKGNQ
jgi:hypothetical protein